MTDNPVPDQDKAPSQTETTTDTAPDELDSLLAQYDNGQKPTEPKAPDSETLGDLKESLNEVKVFAQEQREERRAKAVTSAIETVKGDLNMPDKLVRGWLEAEAQENPQVGEAFRNQGNPTSNWPKIAEALGRKFAKEMSEMKIDKAATEDRAAVEASVRGATKASEESDSMSPEEAARMTPAEHTEWKRKHGWVAY